MKNITVSVPDDVYRNARVAAAQRDTSLSALVVHYLERLSGRMDEFARLEALLGPVEATTPGDLHGLPAEDVLAIQAVIMKYGFLIDDRQFDRLGEVFTADATVDYRPGGAGPFAGLAEIDQAMKTLQHPVQHMMVSHIIDSVAGDEVVTRTKALIPLATGGIADISYRDVLVRTPAGWRIRDKSTRSYRPPGPPSPRRVPPPLDPDPPPPPDILSRRPPHRSQAPQCPRTPQNPRTLECPGTL